MKIDYTKTTYTLEELNQIMKENDGWLDLRYTKIESLPDNLTVEDSLDLRHSAIESLPDDLIVDGYLDLSFTPITSLPDNLTVGGKLDLRNSLIKSLPDNLIVGGDLDLYNTPIKSLPNNLIVGGKLDLRHTKIKSLPDNLIVGGSLDLGNTPIKSLPNNLIVGLSLNLDHTPIKSLPDNLTVGWNLCLVGTNIKSLPDNLIVGHNLIVDHIDMDIVYSAKNIIIGGNIIHDDMTTISNKYLKHGEYVEGRCLCVDGILTLVKRVRKLLNGKYTYYIGKIPGRNVLYDGTYYAHCSNIKEGIRGIEFKHAKDRGSNQYKHLTVNDTVSKDKAIMMYRIITGACLQGVQMFIHSLPELKEEYTIQEVIDMTEGQYGHNTFKEFFMNK